MASPICQVSDNGGGQQSTVNGVNVGVGDTVVLSLVSSAGVSQWSISCIGTDETQVATTITAGLTINALAKTSTYTAPSISGTCLLFQSTVTDNNNVTTSTTFAVFTLTQNGTRVGAVGLTVEGSLSFGWVAIISAAARGTMEQSLLNTFNSTTALTAQATPLTFTMGPSDIWRVEFQGFTNVASGTSGLKASVTGPTGATLVDGAFEGHTTGPTAYSAFRMNTINTLVGPLNTASATIQEVWGWFIVKGDGTHGGLCTLNIAPVAAVVASLESGFNWSGKLTSQK